MITGHSGTTLLDAAREHGRTNGHHAMEISMGGADGSSEGVLNPSFVEALMGFPIDWTVSPRSETLSFPW
jgi:hypothetical protein